MEDQWKMKSVKKKGFNFSIIRPEVETVRKLRRPRIELKMFPRLWGPAACMSGT